MKIKLLLGLLLFSSSIFAQVIISPYIVYTDNHNRYGSYIVENKSTQPYEITVSFVFGYPVSDSSGTMKMKYLQETTANDPSIVKWIKAFPKKFILNPDQKQTIRLSVRPDRHLSEGTYWARIVTSASPKSLPVDTVKKGITAQIKFVLNQVTTLFYRVDSARTSIKFDTVWVKNDSGKISIFASMTRTGNSPYLGDLSLAVKNVQNQEVFADTEYIPLYFQLVKRFDIDKSKLPDGTYSAEFRAENIEKRDVPESNIGKVPAIIKKIIFTVP